MPNTAVLCAALAAIPFLCAFKTLPKTGQTLTVYAGERTYVFSYPEIDLRGGTPYLKGAKEIAERICMDALVRPIDAEMVFTPDSKDKFTFKSERAGRGINEKELLENIDSAVKKGTSSITARFEALPASVTKKELESFTFRRAEFKTRYGNSPDGRKRNIELAAKKINGTVLGEGEAFSFNGTVGERTVERGFSEAKVIFEGKFTDGIGGGVCQVSGTLYNCALLAGLSVTERHAHSVSVGYLEPSFDAAVSYGNADLKFLNDSGGKIFIEAVCDGEALKFVFYGKRQDVEIRRKSTVISQTDAGYELIEDFTGELCGEESEKTISPQKCALKSRAALEYYFEGRRVKTLDLGSDSYSGIKGKKAIRKYA